MTDPNPLPVEQVLASCPNPWCEDEEGVSVSVHTGTGRWHVTCDDCMIEGPWGESYAEAIAAWNHRAARPSPSREEIARVIDPEAFAHLDHHSDTPVLASRRRHALAKADAILALCDRDGVSVEPLDRQSVDRASVIEECARVADQWGAENRASCAKARKSFSEGSRNMAEMLDGAAIECNAIAAAIRGLKR